MLGPVCSVLGFALLAQGGRPVVPPDSAETTAFAASSLPAAVETAAPARTPVPLPDWSHDAGDTRALSKKAAWLLEKRQRPNIHVTDAALATTQARHARPRKKNASTDVAAVPVGNRLLPLVTLFNMKTREALPVFDGPRLPGEEQSPPFCSLLRDHFTNQVKEMDPQLLEALARAAQHFRAKRIEIVSGYRSPKYNLMLRKKGREVAEASQHTVGHAVDFRVRGVPTRKLWQFVRSLRLGGVGFYPHSEFVHCDTGPVRFWRGS